MKLTLEHIDRTINNLDRLMPAKLNKSSTREYSLKECIFLMAPKLLEKREMGCTTNELVKALADDEIVIKAATLNHYLCEYQKQPQDKPAVQPGQAKQKTPPECSDPGDEKSGLVTPPANQEEEDTPKEESPTVPSQSNEMNKPASSQYAAKPKPDFRPSAERGKPESGQYAEKPKPEFGQFEKRGDNG